jgi:MarR family transcriptional regulator for hemolysin
MENNSDFKKTLQEWIVLFARRSIHDFLGFARENGLSMAQISVLLRLHYRGPVTIADLRKDTAGSRAAASQMIDELVRAGLVQRREAEGDRRLKVVSLTDPGKDLVLRGIAARQRWLEQMVEALPAEQRAQIGQWLRVMIDAALALENNPPDERQLA